MSTARRIFRGITKISVYALISAVLGTLVTIVESNFDNMLEKKEITSSIRQQIKQAVRAYQATHHDIGPEEVATFVKEYVVRVLPDKAETEELPANTASMQNDKPVWSVQWNTGQLLVFLLPAYLKEQTTGADVREIIDGVLATFLIFMSLLVYITTNERVRLERRLHDEERRRLTTALHEQEAFALLGRMTATLSHELRTPVATISNLIHALPAHSGDLHFAERLIAISREELARMQRLIDNLLVYGKDPKLERPEWLDLRAIVQNAAIGYDLTLTTDYAKIYGDPFYMELLFANLLRNSVDADAHKVKVTIKEVQEYGRMVLEYEDDGTGFPVDTDLKSLCSPFVTTRSKGAGLGLYLVDKIVRTHGGELELYRPERGAGLRIWLPANAVKMAHEQV